MIINDIELVKLYCQIDEFCKKFIPIWQRKLIESNSTKSKVRKHRKDCLTYSEIITILILYNSSSYSCFKYFYIDFVSKNLKAFFPNLPCYHRFTTLQKKAFIPMLSFLLHICKQSQRTGLYYIDSTFMEVCKNQRIYRHKTFKKVARRGKTSVGWFFGFKLHLVINQMGEILNLNVTKGNISDSRAAKSITQYLFGKLFGDKGYLSKSLKEDLFKNGLALFTKVRKNMKPQIISRINQFLLSKRGVVETVIGQFKTRYNMISTRYRTISNYFMNIISAIAAYQLNPRKPKININQIDNLNENMLVKI